MATSEKAMQISRDLFDALSKQVYATMPYSVQSYDSLGNPTFTVSEDATPTLRKKVVVVTVKPYATGTAKDVFGNTATAFTPHVIQFCTEANNATSAGTADILTPTDLLPVITEIARRGCYVEWHVTANGTVPSAAAIVAGTVLSATWRPLYFGVQIAS